MKSRKGVTLIELLVVIFIIGIILSIVIGGIVGIVCLVKGIGAVDMALDNRAVAYEQRLETNPPLYDVGDIVYHKASRGRMIVAKKNTLWNELKNGWDIKVKDGGSMDTIGGFIINETEVTPTKPPE